MCARVYINILLYRAERGQEADCADVSAAAGAGAGAAPRGGGAAAAAAAGGAAEFGRSHSQAGGCRGEDAGILVGLFWH